MTWHHVTTCHSLRMWHAVMTCHHVMPSHHAMAYRLPMPCRKVRKCLASNLDALTVPEALVHAIRILAMFSTRPNLPQPQIPPDKIASVFIPGTLIIKAAMPPERRGCSQSFWCLEMVCCQRVWWLEMVAPRASGASETVAPKASGALRWLPQSLWCLEMAAASRTRWRKWSKKLRSSSKTFSSKALSD